MKPLWPNQRSGVLGQLHGDRHFETLRFVSWDQDNPGLFCLFAIKSFWAGIALPRLDEVPIGVWDPAAPNVPLGQRRSTMADSLDTTPHQWLDPRREIAHSHQCKPATWCRSWLAPNL
jgi:hypothetical protein